MLLKRSFSGIDKLRLDFVFTPKSKTDCINNAILRIFRLFQYKFDMDLSKEFGIKSNSTSSYDCILSNLLVLYCRLIG